MKTKHLEIGMIVEHDGDTWEIIGLGVVMEWKTFTHLASKTRGRHQRNGFRPIMIVDWLEGKPQGDNP